MNASRTRKITYMLIIVVLFTCMLGLSGFLDAAAEEHKLAQKSLGNIDPVSGTANLVFLGFRGIAVTFLWHDAIELKRQQRWFEIRPVIESITLLQPNFIEPWTYQAWNMAYNISAEWEAVGDKYYWIMEGIKFMQDAVVKNHDQPDMQWEAGWLHHNRFGASDEKTHLRKIYAADESIPLPTSGIRDNFEVAYDKFKTANDSILRLNVKSKRRGIGPFMSYPAVSKSKYAEFRGLDGKFGETTRNAWRTAHEEWLTFGRRGDPDRSKSLIFKVEYEPGEYAKLDGYQKRMAEHYAKIVNYFYWKNRTRLEATEEMDQAHEQFYKANRAADEADLFGAVEAYEKGFRLWRKILQENPDMRRDVPVVEDTQANEARYLRIIDRNFDESEYQIPDDLRPRPMEGVIDPSPLLPSALFAPRMNADPGADVGPPNPNP